MNNIIDNWSKLKEITEETIKVPFTYMMFFLLNVLIYSSKGQQISEVITLSNVIRQIITLLTELLSIIFNNYIAILLIVTLIALLILVLFKKTNIFNKLPEDIEYTDGTVVSWNPLSAVNRLFSLIFSLSTDYFIFYCCLIFIINPNFYIVDDYFIFLKNQENSNILNILWSVNCLILFRLILQAFFVIKYTDKKRYLKYSLRYNTISSFSISSERNTVLYMIVRNSSDFSNYYLLQVETHKQQLKETIGGLSNNNGAIRREWIKEEIPKFKRQYHILDKSENLSDIIYYYDELKKKYSNNED
ncbi:hypothetical protein [Streptococcus salivarius]|uniref:hypothetical protein n=1 Tax=Streptococcus salivarius TaxID=1304 RepID=UPI0022E276B1|nr:hypothetical protein [Streptococcus salivarius]